jgi:predicted NBD/HSP70 family sugar kinase
VETSVKACILAQVWAVTGDVVVDGPVAFVNVSDGVGVGIAIDGKLVRGANNIAGEFGHVSLSLHGPVCSCGQRGCWEAYVESRRDRALSRRRPSWSGPPEPGGPTVKKSPRARGRRGARWNAAGDRHYLGRGISTIIKASIPAAAWAARSRRAGI